MPPGAKPLPVPLRAHLHGASRNQPGAQECLPPLPLHFCMCPHCQGSGFLPPLFAKCFAQSLCTVSGCPGPAGCNPLVGHEVRGR